MAVLGDTGRFDSKIGLPRRDGAGEALGDAQGDLGSNLRPGAAWIHNVSSWSDTVRFTEAGCISFDVHRGNWGVEAGRRSARESRKSKTLDDLGVAMR